MIIRICIFVLGLWLAAGSHAMAESHYREAFIKANRAYQDGLFGEAQKEYQRLLDHDKTNGHLHYNLGNTYIKQGKPGPAIWHYLKAVTFLPRDEDVEANLQLALRETSDIWDGRHSPPAGALFFWLEDFTFLEHLQALLILNLAFWLFSAINLARKNEGLETARKIMAGLAMVTLIACGARWSFENTPNVAVVQEKSLDAVAAQSLTGKTLFQFHEGAVLAVLSESKDWVEVELPSGERGWVKKNGILL